MNYGNPNYSFSDYSSLQKLSSPQGTGITAKKTKQALTGENAKVTFQKSFCEVAAEVKRELTKIAAKELENSRIRCQALFAKTLKKKEDDPLDLHYKCMKIARKIMKGERVSIEELRYLMEYDPQLYFMSMLFKQEKPHEDEDEKFTLDDEDEGDDYEDDSGDIAQTSCVDIGASGGAVAAESA